MNKLKSFLASNQIMSYRPPTLGRKEVDLYRLFREVTAYGGCESVVSKEGTWAKIYRGLDNFSPTETSASFRLKKMYTKYLLAYEKHVFNFLPMPAKKHRYSHAQAAQAAQASQAAQTSQAGQTGQTTQASQGAHGIQNSAIFPPGGSYAEHGKAQAKASYANALYTDTTLQSSLLSNMHYTPGAGIGLIGGNVNGSAGGTGSAGSAGSAGGWEKEGSGKTRGASMKRSFEASNLNAGGREESSSRGEEIGGHRLRSATKESYRVRAVVG